MGSGRGGGERGGEVKEKGREEDGVKGEDGGRLMLFELLISLISCKLVLKECSSVT